VTLTLAATSTNTPEKSVILLLLFALIVTVGYTVACWLTPFTHCHRCNGVGTSHRKLSDRLRYGPKPRTRAARARPDCPRCRGTGLRLRIGRRVANRARRAHRNATR
jgi:hypothetical protein